MQLFDLIFIACFLSAVAFLLSIGWAFIRRRPAIALRRLAWLCVFAVAYFAVLIAVSLASSQRVLHVGDTRCFDDWCIGVTEAKAAQSIPPGILPHGRFLLVTIRVSSQAKRVQQSEPSTEVLLLDGNGHQYAVDEAAQRAFENANGKQIPIGGKLYPGDSFTTIRVFDVPRDLKEIGLATRQNSPGPGRFVIGDDHSLFHKPTVFKIVLP